MLFKEQLKYKIDIAQKAALQMSIKAELQLFTYPALHNTHTRM